jgi:hypothetical protein
MPWPNTAEYTSDISAGTTMPEKNVSCDVMQPSEGFLGLELTAIRDRGPPAVVGRFENKESDRCTT